MALNSSRWSVGLCMKNHCVFSFSQVEHVHIFCSLFNHRVILIRERALMACFELDEFLEGLLELVVEDGVDDGVDEGVQVAGIDVSRPALASPALCSSC